MTTMYFYTNVHQIRDQRATQGSGLVCGVGLEYEYPRRAIHDLM